MAIVIGNFVYLLELIVLRQEIGQVKLISMNMVHSKFLFEPSNFLFFGSFLCEPLNFINF